MNKPYATHASQEFNERLHGVLQRLTADVRRALGDNLVALVLGGSYGHGEGGVVRIGGVEHPYNDLDFTLVVRRRRPVPMEALEAIRKRYEEEVGIAFDFSRPMTIGNIRRWRSIMYWHDLFHGHTVLAGPPDVVSANTPARVRDPLPPEEADRVLLSRGGGLLWAMRVVRGVEPPPDPDFVRRNYYKCVLALGDAVLLLHRQYTTGYGERAPRFGRIAEGDPEVAALRIEDLFRTALQFKFCPDSAPNIATDEATLHAIAERWGKVLLYVERKRTGRDWPSVKEYVEWGGLRELREHTPLRLLRNILRNRQSGIWSWRGLREGLYRRLPVLLGLTDMPVADWPGETARFLAVWRRAV